MKEAEIGKAGETMATLVEKKGLNDHPGRRAFQGNIKTGLNSSLLRRKREGGGRNKR